MVKYSARQRVVPSLKCWRNLLIMSLIGTLTLFILLVFSQITTSTTGMVSTTKTNIPAYQRRQGPPESDVVHILMRLPLLHASQPNAINRYQENFEWLLEYSTIPLHLHLVVPRDSFKLVDKILTLANTTSTTKCEVTKYDFTDLTRQLAAIAHVDFGQEKDFADSVGRHMSALLLPFYFLHIKRLIVAESNIIMRSDVADLFAHFRHFELKQVMGVTLQQVPKYRNAFAMYEKYHPASGLGKPARPGFNTGLVLLDLQKMRHSMQLNAYLHYPTVRWLVHKYWLTKGDGGGVLSQDDVFTLMGFEHPELFYILPCGWNRQLEAVGYSQSEAREYNRCDGKTYAENVQGNDLNNH